MNDTEPKSQQAKERLSKILLVVIGVMMVLLSIQIIRQPRRHQSGYEACLEASENGFGKREWCALQLVKPYKRDP